MPFAAALVILDVLFVIHAAKTGRLNPWAYLILLLPGVGVIAYVVVELVPEWLGSVQGQRARKTVMQRLDPERRYRELTDAVEITDTVANRVALAAECLELEKFDEALRHYEVVLKRPNGDDPLFALGKARALFGMGHADATVAALDELRATWPSFESADGHLLYARALEAAGRTDAALAEYDAVANYFPGAEARVRHSLLLDRVGRQAEARALLNTLLTQMRRAPKFAQKTQAEWIALAEKTLRA
jgi:hypothetical protein